MKTAFIPLFAASLAGITASASIKSHFRPDCTGGYLSFPEVNAHQCAHGVQHTDERLDIPGTPSASYTGIPSNSQLFGWRSTHDASFCGELKARYSVGDEKSKCVTHTEDTGFEGTSWAKKGDNEKCEGSIDPSWLVLDDGHMYSLKNMSLTMISDLYIFGVNGKTYAGLPDSYDDYEVYKNGVESRLQDM
ncbi:hypothetical protein BU26DRAFT_602456 [Trematosphaeria pertusa]|uniref:Ecp2 effector protein domain-containing protein n=1 Tax=Trematosphaeria pertusa TaxID=390896 RepID=A0A6A6IN44_9PLEO|nr:uncharacterized protein BU26DRAFT_602456 [Trematosphaeria pertusa]KAF2251985.1 hypothetical protein BU26DRAFT_602456 [Trematosphaeria pertusa]